YDGFSFDGKVKLYNPFSVLSFFNTGTFINFWMASGSDTFIRTFLKDKELTADQFQGMEVDVQFASNPGEIDVTPPEGFLYQAGYLTLRTKSDTLFTMDYPNREVRESISKLFLENLNSDWNGIGKSGRELAGHLASGDVPGMTGIFRRLFAGIHYGDHLDANRAPQPAVLQKAAGNAAGAELPDAPQRELSETYADKLSRKKGESWYRSLLQSCLWTAGAKVTPEKPENKGRLDLEVVFGRMTYVIELKVSDDARGAAAAVRAGMDQIHEREYGRATENPILVSLAVGRAERNIVGCLYERDGQETAVEVDF
ncbi:MAG: ATP-binding protein, partial [Deltaproteobacteria bacterium]|nr:ATP-binding protein [Deltaproteobacteria bacterium]